MKHKQIISSGTLPIPGDNPQIERTEAERAKASLKEYTLTECERMAYNERYGAPLRPYKPPSGTAFVPNSKRKGKGA